MRAAVLHHSGEPPKYESFPDPIPNNKEYLIRMRAASLKNIDRMMANGSHYDRSSALPRVVGIDGAGVLEDGTRVYCAGCPSPYGTMAEMTVAPLALPIPDEIDDVTAAALPNPTLSSWLALTWRARMQQGAAVLVLGATGVAGRLAVQIARHLGAGRVIGAGRNPESLATLAHLGADATIALDTSDEELRDAFRQKGGYDIVLDYLWGHPTEVLLDALTGDDVMAESRHTHIIEIGSMAGPTIQLPAAALRSSDIEISGGGGGSVPHEAIFETFPKLWEAASSGAIHVDCETVALREIESAWNRKIAPGKRMVIVP
ncbi:MAG TPA: zinc-binding alcohol dehydrogenase family protein [Thermomicrobiales bacterium]|nr:zinc-binding alcohol dehydrogenase family protein [Thermomicrobiales bacterium]